VTLTLTGPRSIFADDHEVFRDSARRFLTTEVVPHLEDWRIGSGIPRSVVRAAGEAGFLGISVPEDFGGGGTDDNGFLAVLIEETVAVGATGLALLWALHAGVTIPCLLDHGTVADKQRWLPGLVNGELIGIPAARGPVTVHDGHLSGTLSGVPGGRLADLLLIDVGDVQVVATEHPGVHVDPAPASLASPDIGLADIVLEHVATDAADVLPSTAFHRDIDLWLAVVALAGARTALALGLDYVQSRKIFGRPLAEFENTRFRLAEMSAELSTATTSVDQRLTARVGGCLDAAGAAAARLIAVALNDRAVDQSMQLHGGYGYMREYPIAQAFADARFLRQVGQAHSDPRHVLADHLGL
jgi:acyl-CoA dehydrogenase